MNMKTDRQKEEIEKQFNKEEMKERLYRDYTEFLRRSGPSFDWVEFLLAVIITVIAVGFSSLNIAYLIEMVIEHKFAYWKAAMHIFWAIVLLGQWVYHWAKMLKIHESPTR